MLANLAKYDQIISETTPGLFPPPPSSFCIPLPVPLAAEVDFDYGIAI